jgi:hypothetical protein
MLLLATSNDVGVNVRLVGGYGLSVSRYQGIYSPSWCSDCQHTVLRCVAMGTNG